MEATYFHAREAHDKIIKKKMKQIIQGAWQKGNKREGAGRE